MGSGTQGPARLVGQAVGGYRLERMLGKGATGAVFLGQRLADTPRIIERTAALALELPDEAAIKVLILPWQLEDSEREDFHARFEREARTLQRLRHPNIVSILDYGDDPETGYTYMALPYMSGGTLATRLEKQAQPMPLDAIVPILAQVADALDYAHSQGVVHRDIKPANILLDGKGGACVADFSIVRILAETHTQLTATGGVVGTPEYMAPEQIDGSGVGPAADIYGLGMVVYQLVTGHVAFTATSIIELIRLQTQEPPTPPRMLRPDLPEPAEAAILKALAKEPEQRFASAAEFANAFALGVQGQWAEGLTRYVPPLPASAVAASIAPTQPDDPTAGHGNGRRRRSWIGVLGAALALLLVAGLGGALFAYRDAYALLGRASHNTPISNPTPPANTVTPTQQVATATTGGAGPGVPSGPPPGPGGGPPSYSARLVSASGAMTVSPGQSFSATFTFENAGSGTLDGSVSLVCAANCFGAGPQALQQTVAPGGEFSFTVDMSAPSASVLTSAHYSRTSTWELKRSGSVMAGTQAAVAVSVKGWSSIFYETRPYCDNKSIWMEFAGAHACTSSALKSSSVSGSYPEVDLTGFTSYSATNFRASIQHVSLNYTGTTDWVCVIADTPPAANVFGGNDLCVNPSGQLQLQQVRSDGSNYALANGSCPNFSRSDFSIQVAIQGGVIYGGCNGHPVLQYSTSLNSGVTGLIQETQVYNSAYTVYWSGYEIDAWK